MDENAAHNVSFDDLKHIDYEQDAGVFHCLESAWVKYSKERNALAGSRLFLPMCFSIPNGTLIRINVHLPSRNSKVARGALIPRRRDSR